MKKRLVHLEKVRVTAGNIARDLSARKVASTQLSATLTAKWFTELNKKALITAFAEGWELGAYQFVKYKAKYSHFRQQ